MEEPRRRLSGPVRATQAKKAYCAVHSTKQVTASPYVLAAGRQPGFAFLRARMLLGRRRHDHPRWPGRADRVSRAQTGVPVPRMLSEEQCCRIITSIDDACMHPRTINSLALLQACREVGGRSVVRAGGRQGFGLLRRKKGGEVRLDSILASISIIVPRASAVQGWWPCDDS